MYMSYTTNPHMPTVRRDAVRLVCYRDWSVRKVARYIGVEPSTVSRWTKLDPTGGRQIIPTQSSRPHHHPNALAEKVVLRILEIRAERHQCAEIIHWRLKSEGVAVSLSSVKRVLRRHGLSRFSRWKKWHQYSPRPVPEKPGILVQVDSVMDGVPQGRLSAYALIDLCSRWAYAEPTEMINTHQSLRFIDQAQRESPFRFRTLQSDNGSEFSKYFTTQLEAKNFVHRHSRVRRPTDNGHVERFIRTLQEGCLNRIPRSFLSWQKEIPEFIRYYNNERPHMALGMRTPLEVLRSY